MNNINLSIKMIVVMVVITAVSGVVLSGVWRVSEEKIAQNEKMKVEEAMQSLSPEKVRHEIISKDGLKIYKCFDSNDILISYFFLAEGNGFQAPIKVATAVDTQWKKIYGIRILEQSETPGLGAKITENSFYEKFKELFISNGKSITCIKDDAVKEKSEIRAITAATISSKAVVDLLNLKIEKIRKAEIR